MRRRALPPCRSADPRGAILDACPGGTILAGHSRAVYLLAADDELLWLAPEDVPMHRRGSGWPGHCRMPAQGRRTCTPMAGSCSDPPRCSTWAGPWPGNRSTTRGRIDPWRPPAERPPRKRHDFARRRPALAGRLRGVPARAHRVCPRRSAPESGVATIPRPGGCLAVPSSASRERAERGTVQRILGHAAGLVGLGEGLTPSGDDFLGGVFFGLAELRRAGLRLPGCGPTRAGIVPGICEAAHQSDQLRVARTTMRPVTAASQRIVWPGRSWWRRIARGDPSSVIRAGSCRALHWLGSADRDVDGMGARPRGGDAVRSPRRAHDRGCHTLRRGNRDRQGTHRGGQRRGRAQADPRPAGARRCGTGG